MELEKLKKIRSTEKGSITKLINKIDKNIEENVTVSNLKSLLHQLNTKIDNIKRTENEILKAVDLKSFDTEITAIEDFHDNLLEYKSNLMIKIDELSENAANNSNEKINVSSSEIVSNVPNRTETLSIKLPRIQINKFTGSSSNYLEFMSQFENAIDRNPNLSKIDKLIYLKSFLSGSAAQAISGFELIEQNYDAALELLRSRFGQKNILINSHLGQLLNISPVRNPYDINGLRKLFDHIEVQIRNLEALKIDSNSYGNILTPLILKLLPNEFVLDFSRKNKDDNWDLKSLLDFLRDEILSRERASSINYNSRDKYTRFANPHPRRKSFDSKPKTEVPVSSSAIEFMTSVNEKGSSEQCCFLCNNLNHRAEKCNEISIDKKKEILKRQGRCFLCLKPKHCIKSCRSNISCKNCNGRHNETICFKSNLGKEKDKNDPESAQIENKNEIISAISHTEKSLILLQTCSVKAKNENREVFTRCLCDNGSMRSFCSQEIVNKLNLTVIRTENLSVFTFGNKTPITKTYDVVKITLENRNLSSSKLEIEALVTDNISGSNIPPPEVNDLRENKKFKNLTLADTPGCKEPISVLIGADYYYDVVTGNILHINKSLVAVQTIFGWCLQGRKSENYMTLAFNVIIENNMISEQIKKFWDLETSGLFNIKQESDPSENEILKQFESDIKYENKRYTVRLPWKVEKHQCLNDNRKIAEARFLKLKKRFIRNPELFFEYKEVLIDYLKQGIIEPVVNSEDCENTTFYLPHREVIRRDRSTSKLRIVFDASAHDENSLSLNDCLHIGPNLYPEIFDILIRFRFRAIAFTSDMKQAFLQIFIDEQDRDVSRFFFTENPSDKSELPLIYRFTRVLFGISSSPFLLAATIKYHLKKFSEKYPGTVSFLNENVYVDDIIGSLDTVEEALTTTTDSIKIFEEASLLLHKWHTNSKPLHLLWKENGVISSNDSPQIFAEENLHKVLGIAWDNLKDLLYFDIRDLINFISNRVDTKRFILQVLGRIFDPIGFLGPFTLRIKCLVQKIWSLGIDWDETLPESICSSWEKWCGEISELRQFSVPRHYFSDISDKKIEDLQLHLFSDASLLAYGTVAYFRVKTSDEAVYTAFVASKNRVSPMKTLTLPRLELMAALLSAKLSSNILKALKQEIQCYFWTDSKITYFWIRGLPEKFKLFVRNRVEEIHKLTSPSDWFHCPGSTNPSDMVSRGTKISKLINDPVWLRGPQWLSLSPEFWPKSEDGEIACGDELEYKKKFTKVFQGECVVEEVESIVDVTRYSNLEKLVRVTALVRKFVKKIKKLTDVNNTLTAEDLIEAENYLIANEQKKFFKQEFECLKNRKPMNKNSSLCNFNPYLDENELLRLGGRLEFSDLLFEEKHPFILPKGSWLTKLIVLREHEKIMHGGVAATLTRIRSRYWIPKGRQLVKSIIKRCLICQKYLSKPADQITAPLPRDRINEAPPFSVIGIDFAGPIYVKNFKITQKSYVVLFTCGVTRAIHLEHVSDMTTNSFLLAFRRFIARRGNCKTVYSDNAKTFKKAKSEIAALSQVLSDDVFLKFIAKEKIVWKFIVERAAWWGGFYERLVKSVKDCLRKIVGRALLNFEEMTTLLSEVEAVLNLRPLTFVYDENNEPQPLTPAHFLNFGKEPSYPITFAEILQTGSKSSLLRRKKYQSLLLKQLWSKWKQQYLLDLKTAHSLKNPTPHPELKIGDVVLIGEDTKNKFLWKLGKIEKALLGRDNKVRSYEVKTGNGLLKRTVQHLYPLEL